MPKVGASRHDARRLPRARRYWTAFLTFGDALRMDESHDWPFVLTLGGGLVVLLLAVVRVTQTFALRSNDPIVGCLGVFPALLITVALLIKLARAYWLTLIDPSGVTPYIQVALFSVVVLAVSVEAFAGLTALLSAQGAVTTTSPVRPTLWSVERYYLWHLADSVPLLSLPSTLGWSEPTPFVDHVSGTLLLAFKLVVIVPMLHIAVSGYHLVAESWRKQAAALRAKAAKEGAGPGDSFFAWTASFLPWGTAGGVLLAALGAVIVVIFVSDPSSALNHWIDGWTRNDLHVAGLGVPLRWVRTVPQWIAVAALVWLAGYVVFAAASTVWFAEEDIATSTPAIVALVTMFVCLLILLAIVCAAVTLALLRTGLASARPSIPPGDQASAAVATYAWHIADAVPALKIPSTLNWSLNHEFVDPWDRIILLAYKAVFFGVLIVPLARYAAFYVGRMAARRNEDAGTSA